MFMLFPSSSALCPEHPQSILFPKDDCSVFLAHTSSVEKNYSFVYYILCFLLQGSQGNDPELNSNTHSRNLVMFLISSS
jgi:hypothetical protein